MNSFRSCFGLILALYILFILVTGCQNPASKETPQQETKAAAGKRLAQAYCAGCHLVPQPELLDKKTWKNHVLVRMAAFLGVYTDNVQYYDSLLPKWLEPGIGGRRVIEAGIYPPEPLITREDYENIMAYYLDEAPEISQGVQNVHPIFPETEYFKATPLLAKTGWQPYVFGVTIDGRGKKIYASLYQQDVLGITTTGEVLEWMGGNVATTDIKLDKGRITLTDLGSMPGIDTPKGGLKSGKSLLDMRSGRYILRMDSLQRPVHSLWHDLDGDGKEDLLLCEYGNFLGQLTWHKNLGNGKFEENLLYAEDGTSRAAIHDMNGDSLPDIVTLVGNGDEGIDVYLNQGKGKFDRRRVMRFQPTNGSTWIDMVDFDKDGKLDILYSNGDNGDYPPILKSHHGIRLFKNMGNLDFKESFYLPLNGANKAEAHDFDNDGDLDIAAISYYPDFVGRPEEAFVLYENQGGNQFTASTFPGVDRGRWMVFDVGDVDQDGDLDIVLGAFNQESVETPMSVREAWKEYDTPLMLLENTMFDQ